MTIDYFMQHIADPTQLYSVGSNSGFFFIGTRSEWNRYIDDLSKKRLKYLRSRRTAALYSTPTPPAACAGLSLSLCVPTTSFAVTLTPTTTTPTELN